MRSQRSATSRVDILAVPAADSRLSRGVVVEGDIVARLFGMRVLTVDADVVLVPAELRRADELDVVPTGETLAATHRVGVGATGATRGIRRSVPSRRATLEDASRLLAETDEALQRARHTG